MRHYLTFLFFLLLFESYSQNWQQLSDFPDTQRDDGTGFIIGDSAFFGTGITPWWSVEGSFHGFDLINESWFSTAAMPSGQERQYAAGFSGTNNKGYVFGGYNGSVFLNDLWFYDPITDSWTELTSLPSVGRSGAACFVLNDTAYILGGKTATDFAIDEVWAYSIISDTWTQKSSLPFGKRWRSSATELNGAAYLIFGRDEQNSFHNELYQFDPMSDNWQQISEFPSIGRSHASMSTINNELHVCFGLDSLDNSHNDLWRYDPVLDTWTLLPGLPSLGRRGGIALQYQNILYYSTGIDEGDQRLTETWKYDPYLYVPELESNTSKKLIRIVDLMGQETEDRSNTLLIYVFSDGSTEKVYRVE